MPQTVNPKRGALADVEPRVEFLAISNTPPLERERIEMAATLVRVRALIKRLNPKKMAAQRAQLEAYADKLASVIHPMRFIPPEILGEIFSHLVTDPDITCQGVKNSDFVDSLDTNSGVWALTHVCSRWRQIVTNTSSLWTTVGLPFDKHPQSSATADILATYLERSNQRALNVIVHSKDEISNQPAMELLMKTCQRWRKALFSLPLEVYLAWQTPFPFKQLYKLRVCIQQPTLPLAEFAEDSTARCHAFGDAPVLIHVAVDHHVIFYELFDLDWTTLRIFSQEQRLSDEFSRVYPVAGLLSSVMILSEASSLQCAQFDLRPFDTQFEDEWLEFVNHYMPRRVGVIRNAVLSFLVLKGASKSWTRILSSIELPNLQLLHYHPGSRAEAFPDPLPTALGGNLRQLVVHVVDDTDTNKIVSFLKMTPGLLNLKIIFEMLMDIGPMCIRVFRMPPDLELVPRLETLTVMTRRRAKVVITKEFITALQKRVDGQGSSKTRLDVRMFQPELFVVNKEVQEELDCLLSGPDPLLHIVAPRVLLEQCT